MQGAWNEFESAKAWFNVLPQKNESTNRVKSTVCSSLQSSQIIVMQPCVCMGGGGGGPPGLITLGQNVQGFSHHKYESCGKTDQSSSPV